MRTRKKRKLLHFPHWWHPKILKITENKLPSPVIRSNWVRISENKSGITRTKKRTLPQFIAIFYNRYTQQKALPDTHLKSRKPNLDPTRLLYLRKFFHQWHPYNNSTQ